MDQDLLGGSGSKKKKSAENLPKKGLKVKLKKINFKKLRFMIFQNKTMKTKNKKFVLIFSFFLSDF